MIKIKFVLYFSFVLWLHSGCKEEATKVEIPKNVVPIKKMEAFLFDLHKTEAELTQSGIRQDSAVLIFPGLQKNLLIKHKIDSLKLERSLKFYAQRVDLLDSIYTHLLIKAESQK